MNDLYWDRIYAGHYETQFYVNNYKYKVIGEGIEWEAYYMYCTKDRAKRQWRRLRYGASDRLKGAKTLCQIHNANPRRKFKIAGRSKYKVYRNGQYVEVERLDFKEVIKKRDGTEFLQSYGTYHFEIPAFFESYSSEITYLGEDYFKQGQDSYELLAVQRQNDIKEFREATNAASA